MKPLPRSAPTIIYAPGTTGTYAGFEATIDRHYDGNMYEIRVPGGIVCVHASEFKPIKPASHEN